MARTLNKLSARGVSAATGPGRYGDGGGLYLVVSNDGRRRWVLRFTMAGRQQDMGLGSPRDVPLSRAREMATAARSLVIAGENPIAARRRKRTIPTFGEAADALIASMQSHWRNEKHRAQWSMTLATYCASIRDVPVDHVTTDHVLKVLKPIWTTKPETASRLRGRIERVLDAAKSLGQRSGENPAVWRGHLKNLLPSRHKLSRGHHAALPYADLPSFLVELRKRQATAALALEFTILTAARSGETRGAVWSEFDLDKALWTVPAERMKAGREHRVPLPKRAVAILHGLQEARTSEVVFPGQEPGKPLSVMAMDMLLRRMERDTITVHGFRSAFRDWCGNETEFSREIAEAALAHTVGDETERAYRRDDALAKRRKLMEEWAVFCDGYQATKMVPPERHRR